MHRVVPPKRRAISLVERQGISRGRYRFYREFRGLSSFPESQFLHQRRASPGGALAPGRQSPEAHQSVGASQLRVVQARLFFPIGEEDLDVPTSREVITLQPHFCDTRSLPWRLGEKSQHPRAGGPSWTWHYSERGAMAHRRRGSGGLNQLRERWSSRRDAPPRATRRCGPADQCRRGAPLGQSGVQRWRHRLCDQCFGQRPLHRL